MNMPVAGARILHPYGDSGHLSSHLCNSFPFSDARAKFAGGACRRDPPQPNREADVAGSAQVDDGRGSPGRVHGKGVIFAEDFVRFGFGLAMIQAVPALSRPRISRRRSRRAIRAAPGPVSGHAAVRWTALPSLPRQVP